MIVVENLTKTFGGRNLLTAVSFAVSTGEKVGIVGPNGAGKTTLIKVLAGRWRDLNPSLYILAGLFVIKLALFN